MTVASIPKDASGKSAYFEGFPIPTSLGLVSGMAVCLSTGKVLENVPLGTYRVWGQAPSAASMLSTAAKAGPTALATGLGDWGLVHPLTAVFIVWGSLLVSRTVRVPKP